MRNDPLGSTHQKFYLYKSLRTNNSLNKTRFYTKGILYFRLVILYKWINFIQLLFSGRHQNLLNHRRTAVAEFFHYILSQSFISNLTHNTGCPNVVRPFSQPSLRRLADSPPDCQVHRSPQHQQERDTQQHADATECT